jgi:hypothetical protein
MNEFNGCNMLDYYVKLDGMFNLGGSYIDEGSQLHYMIWEHLLVELVMKIINNLSKRSYARMTS